MQEGGQDPGWIVFQHRRVAPLEHLPGPFQDLFHLHTHDGGRKETHRGENGEAPTHVGRNLQGRDPLILGDLAEDPSFRVRGEEEVAPSPLLPQEFRQPALHNQVLRHGLGRGPGFAHHIEEGFPQIQSVQEPAHRARVHVVQDEEAGIVVPGLVIQLIPVGSQESIPKGDGAQSRSPDPQDHDVLEPLTEGIGDGLYRPGPLPELRQLEKPHFPRGPPPFHFVEHLLESLGQGTPEFFRVCAGLPHLGRHHVREIQRQAGHEDRSSLNSMVSPS